MGINLWAHITNDQNGFGPYDMQIMLYFLVSLKRLVQFVATASLGVLKVNKFVISKPKNPNHAQFFSSMVLFMNALREFIKLQEKFLSNKAVSFFIYVFVSP